MSITITELVKHPDTEYLIAEERLSGIDKYYYDLQIKTLSELGGSIGPRMILSSKNLLLKNLIIIGWGGGGGALKRVGENIVVKIGISDVISKEIQIIEALNKISLEPGEKLPFSKYENLSIVEYTAFDLYEKFPELFYSNNIDTNEDYMYKSYSMPFLAKDFMEYYCYKYSYKHFTKFWCYWDKPEPYGVETLTVSELKMYTIAWMKFIENIKTLHKHNFTHGDIKENNMIYNISENEFTLIDFDLSVNINELIKDGIEKIPKYYKPDNTKSFEENIEIIQSRLKRNDINKCINVFMNSFIYYSFGNLYIYEQLYENKELINKHNKNINWENINDWIKDINIFVMGLNDEKETIKVPDNTFTHKAVNSDRELRISPDTIKDKIASEKPISGGKKRKHLTFSKPKYVSVKSKKKKYKNNNKMRKYYTRKN